MRREIAYEKEETTQQHRCRGWFSRKVKETGQSISSIFPGARGEEDGRRARGHRSRRRRRRAEEEGIQEEVVVKEMMRVLEEREQGELLH